MATIFRRCRVLIAWLRFTTRCGEKAGQWHPKTHESTLQYTVAVDGSQTIQAILITNGKDETDVGADADSLRSLAGFRTQIAFKDCGRLNFARTGPGADVVQAIPTSIGMTSKCQIQNLEISGIFVSQSNILAETLRTVHEHFAHSRSYNPKTIPKKRYFAISTAQQR